MECIYADGQERRLDMRRFDCVLEARKQTWYHPFDFFNSRERYIVGLTRDISSVYSFSQETSPDIGRLCIVFWRPEKQT